VGQHTDEVLSDWLGADEARIAELRNGGAIAGWYFIGNTHHLHGFFDFLGRVDPTSRAGAARRARRQAPDNAEIDRILAKIQAQGIGSLTRSERETLSRASRDT
jgi:hypothetical protein